MAKARPKLPVAGRRNTPDALERAIRMGRFATEVEFFANLVLLKMRRADRKAVIGLYFVFRKAPLIGAMVHTGIDQSCNEEDRRGCSIGYKSQVRHVLLHP